MSSYPAGALSSPFTAQRIPSAAIFNTTVTFQRPTETKDAAGSWSKSYAALNSGASYPAAVQPGSSFEAQQLGAERGEQTWDVWVEHGLSLATDDRVITTSDYGTLTLEVIALVDEGGRTRLDHLICTKFGGVTP